jgi:hypothetical protein
MPALLCFVALCCHWIVLFRATMCVMACSKCQPIWSSREWGLGACPKVLGSAGLLRRCGCAAHTQPPASPLVPQVDEEEFEGEEDVRELKGWQALDRTKIRAMADEILVQQAAQHQAAGAAASAAAASQPPGTRPAAVVPLMDTHFNSLSSRPARRIAGAAGWPHHAHRCRWTVAARAAAVVARAGGSALRCQVPRAPPPAGCHGRTPPPAALQARSPGARR